MSVKYPFRINITKNNGDETAFFTGSFATSAENFVSSSEIVERVNNMILSDFKRAATGSHVGQDLNRPGTYYNGVLPSETQVGSNSFLSCSTDHHISGTVTFTDTETTVSNGLKFYEFFGSKVCGVLGLPEGVPIYIENFKLSDDSNDKVNYLSGQVIADGINVKESINFAPQSRMKSNIQWDEENGEGLLQWASGSNAQLRMGYDSNADKYVMSADIDGFDNQNKRFETRMHTVSAHTGSFKELHRYTTVNTSTRFSMPYIIKTGFYHSANNQEFIPVHDLTEVNTMSPHRYMLIAPMDLRLIGAYLLHDGTPGATYINMYVVPDGTESPTLGGGSTTEGDAFILYNYTTDDEVQFGLASESTDGTGTQIVNEGQKFCFSVDPATASSGFEFNITIVMRGDIFSCP